jgi:hypothetical protein
MTGEPYSLSPAERHFFEIVGPWIDAFAKDHNLNIDRWFKDVAIWALEFRHPQEGVGHIVLAPSDQGNARLYCAWWRDDYDCETRWSTFRKPREIALDEAVFSQELAAEMRQILEWTDEDLVPHALPEGMWHSFIGKDQVGAHERGLPSPRP